MASDEDYEIPESGAVFTFGRSTFADNQPSHFFIRNDPVVEISCGDEHTAIVCENGRVFLFGHNDYGQLGLGHTRTITKPSCLKYLKPFHATHIACGKGHTIVSTACQRLFSFGSNSDGQLGVGDMSDRLIPQIVNIEHLNDGTIVAVSAGCLHSGFLTDKGDVYLWGSNSDGQCGIDDVAHLLKPTKVQFNTSINALSCGYYHTAFISEGNLFTFGEEDNGKLGYRNIIKSNVPKKVELDFQCATVKCGGNHTLILSDDGKVYAFGSNFSGQLGIGSSDSETYSPIRLNFPKEIKIIYMSAGESHSAFITENGDLYTCGDARYGKICCEDDSSSYSSPTFISLFTHFCCILVSCGGCHTMVMAKTRPDNWDSDIVCSQSKVSTLPPLKVKKIMEKRENMLNDSEKGYMSIRNDFEKSDEDQNKSEDFDSRWHDRNDSNKEANISHFDDVYVDIQEMQIHAGNNKDILTEKEKSISEDNLEHDPKNSAEIEVDVIIGSEGTIKKLLNIFRKKKSESSIKVQEAANFNECHSAPDEKMIYDQKGNQLRARACLLL